MLDLRENLGACLVCLSKAQVVKVLLTFVMLVNDSDNEDGYVVNFYPAELAG